MDHYELRDALDDTPMEQTEPSPTQKVFEGANIFITGATGFMGKVLIEKLLRSCNVGRIYILVRDKKGVSPQNRLAQIFDDIYFDVLKLQKPGEVRKVICVSGDCSLPGLGLSDDDKAMMSDVNIIFHAAATLYFDQHLKIAYITNVLATKTLLEFSTTISHLQAFIYVSTAYTHAYKNLVEEKFYDVAIDEGELGEICSQLDDVQIGALTPKLVGRWGNTYALTKACTENLISKYDGILPIGVVRPSIVVSTWAEPLHGWINNFYGAVGVVLGTALGFMRVWCCNKNMVGDMIPVDIAINMVLAATCDVVTRNTEAKIYNCVSSTINPITWDLLRSASFVVTETKEASSTKAIGIPILYLVNNRILFWLMTIWHHIIPGVFFDMFLYFTGKPAQMIKIYIKMYNVNKLFIPFCGEKDIMFTSDHMTELWQRMTPLDKSLFNFNLWEMSWYQFWPQALVGLRIYLLKDPMDTLPEGIKHDDWLKKRNKILTAVIYSFIGYLLFLILKWVVNKAIY